MIDKINPFCKTIGILSTALLLAAVPGYRVNLLMMGLALLFLLTSKRTSFVRAFKFLLPALLIALSFFFAGMRFYKGGEVVESSNLTIYQASALPPSYANGLMLSTRIMAYAMLGVVFGLTTKNDEMIASAIQQGRMKPEMAYGILASVHLLPTIKEEYRKSKLAYRVRGVKGKSLIMGPIFCMLVRTVRWSEFLAMAMEARGFSNERTSYLKMKVRPADIIFAAGLPLSVGLFSLAARFF